MIEFNADPLVVKYDLGCKPMRSLGLARPSYLLGLVLDPTVSWESALFEPDESTASRSM